MAMFEAIDDIFKQIAGLNEYSKALVTFASAIGAIIIVVYTIKFIFNLIQGVKLYVCYQFGCCQTDLVKKYGKWALITGATDGIGLAMARDLARRGMSILVVSRNEEKLARTKAELEEEPNVGEVETVKIDLADSSLENFDRIRQQIDPDNRDIGVLINNAGTFPNKYQRFNKFEPEHLLHIANLNMLNPVHMTRMVMPGMLKRGKGLVLNVSSTLGCLEMPYISLYPPTKAFVSAFTRQLQIEYGSHPIDIVAITPGPVTTKLLTQSARVAPPLWLSPLPEDFARSAINAMSAGVPSYSGTIAHGLIKISGKFAQWAGISHLLFKLNLAANAQSFELSPVPKRKRVHLVDTDTQGGDAAQQAGAANKGN